MVVSACASAPPQPCAALAPCENPIPIRVVVVTMFERGAPSGDTPGEFQFWKERLPLNERLDFPHGHHDLYLNREAGILGFVTGIGTMHSAATTMALGLDQRFDFSNAYWLVAGIAGIDPEDASIGSAIWSSYLVDGDLGHEVDAREMPEEWSFGYFPRHTQGIFVGERPQPKGEVLIANPALRDWAFELTRDTQLKDLPSIREERAKYVDHPNAQRPPFVGKGGHIAAMTFWHGEKLNHWANEWVRYWSDGATDFVTSAMEETGTFQAITYLDRAGLVDKDRFMVLRAGSNFTMPPPGVTAVENLLKENEGYAGLIAALESLYAVGSRVVWEIANNWDTYNEQIPGSAQQISGTRVDRPGTG